MPRYFKTDLTRMTTTQSTTYRITPTRDYCQSNSLSYPDFYLAGHDGNRFTEFAEAAQATIELGDDVPWEVVEA